MCVHAHQLTADNYKTEHEKLHLLVETLGVLSVAVSTSQLSLVTSNSTPVTTLSDPQTKTWHACERTLPARCHKSISIACREMYTNLKETMLDFVWEHAALAKPHIKTDGSQFMSRCSGQCIKTWDVECGLLPTFCLFFFCFGMMWNYTSSISN